MTEVLKAGVLSDEIDLGALAHNAADAAEVFVRKVWEASWKNVHFKNLPKWLQDNDYLHRGHRPPLASFAACFKSIFRLHTETGNIWWAAHPTPTTLLWRKFSLPRSGLIFSAASCSSAPQYTFWFDRHGRWTGRRRWSSVLSSLVRFCAWASHSRSTRCRVTQKSLENCSASKSWGFRLSYHIHIIKLF